MKLNAYTITTLSRSAIALLALVVVLAFALCVLLLQPKGRLKCADFGSYEDALAAYNRGATYLDGAPKDGKPCNSYFQ